MLMLRVLWGIGVGQVPWREADQCVHVRGWAKDGLCHE